MEYQQERTGEGVERDGGEWNEIDDRTGPLVGDGARLHAMSRR